MIQERLLSTEEVAKRLNIKTSTVYAYVSRGVLTNRQSGGRRGSLFSSVEIDELLAQRRGHGAGSGVLEQTESSVSTLSDEGVYYRGTPLSELVQNDSFESTARLLWTGERRNGEPFTASEHVLDVAAKCVSQLPEETRTTDRIRVAVAAAGAADPLRHDSDLGAVIGRAEMIIATAVDALGDTPPDAPIAERLWSVLSDREPTADALSLVNVLLIVMADHGLSVSTLAARAAASARSNPYAIVSTGLSTMDGQLHGLTSTVAHRFLSAAIGDPVGALGERLRMGDGVPGFGHRIYVDQDPRAELIFSRMEGEPVMKTVRSLSRQLSGRPNGFPNVNLAIAAASIAHGLPVDAGETIFAVARMAGWIAHAVEEFSEPQLRFRS